jgi:hypothetical protein
MDSQISIRESGDVTILDLRGRATIGADSANGVRKLLLNLAGVTQLDSSGICAIIGTYVSLSRQGGSLKLLCPWGRRAGCAAGDPLAGHYPHLRGRDPSTSQLPTARLLC